jgi:beta-lactam-binding protein with PASTA domain
MQEIVDAGLVVGYVFPSPENADPNSQVAQQYPAPGTQVPPGTQVYLYVKGAADTCP